MSRSRSGVVVLLGLPPFAMFASELAIARSLTEARLAWVLAAAMLLIAIAFAALARKSGRMLLGVARPGRSRDHGAAQRRHRLAGRCLAASLALGITAGPLAELFTSAGRLRCGCAVSAQLGAGPDLDRRAGRPDRDLLTKGFRLGLVAAHDDTPRGRSADRLPVPRRPAGSSGGTGMRCPADDPAIDSLAYLSFPAGRFEREMRDLYGIRPVGHPRPRRMVRHAHWPKDWYPMRADAGPAPEFEPAGRFPFVTVGGTGVYEIPVGPVHAGLIEPGHFRFSVVGETVLRLKARLWFVHRGVEKLFETRPVTEGVGLAERVSGDSSVAHALAHSLAVEDALGVDVPDEVHRLRALLVELERLYNHATDIGALANDVGFSLANAHAQRIREQLLRLNAAVTGHRLMRGAIRPGGVTLQELPTVTELTSPSQQTSPRSQS